MKPIQNITAALIGSIFTVALLILPVSAHAWGNGMQPELGADFNPNQAHEVHVNAAPSVHFAPIINHVQNFQHEQPVVQHQQVDHHVSNAPGYFRRDTEYYGHFDRPNIIVYPYADVDTSFVVPDGYETILVNGETFYYYQGSFFQQVGDQLVAIPAVLGAVVDSIPTDYQIVMADDTHYLFTQGVYYQRVDQGFEVVQGPASDQE